MVKRAADIDVVPLQLCRAPCLSLHGQIAQHLRTAIRCGRLSVGTRLPSTRRMALLLQVSRTTVQTAYDELFAEGLIAGRVGAGSYVAGGVRCVRFTDVDGNPLILRQTE